MDALQAQCINVTSRCARKLICRSLQPSSACATYKLWRKQAVHGCVASGCRQLHAHRQLGKRLSGGRASRQRCSSVKLHGLCHHKNNDAIQFYIQLHIHWRTDLDERQAA